MPRKPTDANLNDFEKDMLNGIEKYGWFGLSVGAGKNAPSFSYSIGVFETFRHPEFIMLGMPPRLMGLLISDLVDRIKKGDVFGEGDLAYQILRDVPCAFRRLSHDQYKKWCLSLEWFTGGATVPVLQVFWPDEHGLFPWDEGSEFQGAQPDLSLT